MAVGSVIINCNCKGDRFNNTNAANFQDKTLGKGMRYYTDSPLGKKQRCTVCSKERTK